MKSLNLIKIDHTSKFAVFEVVKYQKFAIQMVQSKRETKSFRQTSIRRNNPSYEMTKSNLISKKKK